MTTTNYSLNQGQQNAVDAFFEFLFEPGKEFIISGSAGVGKTFTMAYIIDHVMPRYLETCKLIGIAPEYDEVVMTATTNKAAEVLSKSTRRPTSTIHSFLKLKVTEDYSDGSLKLTKTREWKIHERKIIFIDECSMIDTALWKMIQEGTMNCKVVYVGDHNQLAPVQETLSPIYRHNSPFYELTQPMRNSNQPALMAVCQQLRETVHSGVFNPIKIVPGVIDLLDDTDMQKAIDLAFQKQTHEARILCFTNKRVVAYNDHIRGIRSLSNSFQAGELLISATATKLPKAMLPVEAGVTVLKNHGSDVITIEPGVDLNIEHLDLAADCGETFFRVPIPADRTHFEALLKYYAGEKNWERYFFLKNTFVDLRPRDAATVHKSQGSTYDAVFIDLGNISTCNIKDQAARMLYVAFSRARTRVFIYGNLVAKYGGLIS
jgi:hypothetical protein